MEQFIVAKLKTRRYWSGGSHESNGRDVNDAAYYQEISDACGPRAASH